MSEWTDQRCEVCNGKSHHTHHVFFGPLRKHSEKYKLVMRVCIHCHSRIHENIDLNNHFKRIYQKKFEETHTREEFIQIFGRNWL